MYLVCGRLRDKIGSVLQGYNWFSFCLVVLLLVSFCASLPVSFCCVGWWLLSLHDALPISFCCVGWWLESSHERLPVTFCFVLGGRVFGLGVGWVLCGPATICFGFLLWWRFARPVCRW